MLLKVGSRVLQIRKSHVLASAGTDRQTGGSARSA